MSRIIFVPQFPTPLRYQEFFFTEIPNELSKHYDEVIVLGKGVAPRDGVEYDKKLFSPIDTACQVEIYQMREYMALKLKGDDTLLHMDLSFPGLFHNILYHKRPMNCYCYCHATSLNTGDLFEWDRNSKWHTELGNSKLYDRIFVGSKYHADKLRLANTEVVGLPIPPFPTFKEEKIYDIISVARPNPQKVDAELENHVKKLFGPIVRKECKTWEEYYKFLSSAKILLISSIEDTFNYSIMEAILNNTIVLAPNRCSYPELLPSEYIYYDRTNLDLKIKYYLNNYKLVPELLCLDMCKNFYNNISNIIKQ